jgi:3-oxoacyl-[acyl-carrier-protein] synthase III
MLVGEVFLETMATGIITQQEIDWLTTHQASFSREEEAMALKIGRLLDGGELKIGCRLLGNAGAGRSVPTDPAG